MTKPVVNITELDFDLIKESIKQFLKASDSVVKDYDYEGSAANILLDILSANTHYNAFYQNMVANEMFADSAVLRSSVVSHAKTAGYTPRTCRASKATISIEATPIDAGVSSIVVPKGTSFSTKVEDQTQSYVSLDDAYLESDGSKYVGEVPIYAGTVYYEEFVYAEGNRIILKNQNIDTSYLRVSVQKSSTDSEESIFSNGVRYTSLKYNTNAFFVYETDLGFVELRFGDGKMGTALVPGNIVKVSYLIADQDALAGAKTFTISSSFYPAKAKTVSVVNRSSGFISAETIDEIKREIFRIKSSQYRSVVSDDFEGNLKQDNSDILDVSCWGGEENQPPMYGKVFISPVIRDLSFIPETVKTKIISDVKARSVISVRPIVVEPEIAYAVVSGFVRYSKDYDVVPSTIKGLVEEGLNDYSALYLGKFKGSLNSSYLSKIIDLKHDSIFSVVFDFKVYSEIDISEDVLNTYSIHLRNKVNVGSIYSDNFSIPNQGATKSFYIKDVAVNSSKGDMNIYFIDSLDPLSKEQFYGKYGDIEYDTGYITMSQFSGTTALGTTLRIWASPTYTEFVSKQNTILLFDVPESMKNIQAIAS